MESGTKLTREQAIYLMHCLYSVNLSDVKHSLKVLRAFEEKDVRWIILRELVVAYARPFSANNDDQGKRHRLDPDRVVPGELRDLHDELISLRNELIAHTDFDRWKPRVSGWPMTTTKVWGMVIRAPDYAALDARVPEIERLVDAVDAKPSREIRDLGQTITTPARPLQIPEELWQELGFAPTKQSPSAGGTQRSTMAVTNRAATHCAQCR
jgi:hypothetical protein